jgi:ABC-type nitrate/sulfonate/bicarbonate transport system substrate-binding protein
VPAHDELTFVISATVPPLMDTLDLVAQGAGIYASENLTVTKIFVGGVTEAAEIVASGKGDICPIGIEPLQTGYERGLDLRMFMARMGRYTYVLSVLEESPVKALTDLRGARIGIHQIGERPLSGQVAVETMLAAAGLARGDYTLAAIGFNDVALAELTSGRVAAAGFPFYELIPFQVAGTKVRTFRHPVLGDVINAGYAAAPATIAARGDALGRFSRAIAKAALLVRWVPDAAARVLLEALGKPFGDADVARYAAMFALWQTELPAWDHANPRIGYIAPEGMARYNRLIADYGLTRDVVPVEAILTNDFNEAANAFDRAELQALARSLADSPPKNNL